MPFNVQHKMELNLLEGFFLNVFFSHFFPFIQNVSLIVNQTGWSATATANNKCIMMKKKENIKHVREFICLRAIVCHIS